MEKYVFEPDLPVRRLAWPPNQDSLTEPRGMSLRVPPGSSHWRDCLSMQQFAMRCAMVAANMFFQSVFTIITLINGSLWCAQVVGP
jgi:hypothetical protein